MTDYDAGKVKNRKVNKTSNKGKIKRLQNFYTLAVLRAGDLIKLCEMRCYEMTGHRNTLLHIYAYQMFLIHNSYHIVRSKVVELNNKLTDPKLLYQTL